MDMNPAVAAAAREPAVLLGSELQAETVQAQRSLSALIQLIDQLGRYRRPLRPGELVHVVQAIDVARADLQPYIAFLGQSYGTRRCTHTSASKFAASAVRVVNGVPPMIAGAAGAAFVSLRVC